MFLFTASAVAPGRNGLISPPAATDRRRIGATHAGRYVVIVLAGLVGTCASLALFITIGQWQSHVADLRFSSLARDQLQTINSGLKDATDLLFSLRAYFESLDHRVSRSEYLAFSRSLRDRVVGLRDTGWAPRVTAAQREAFEHQVQASGWPDFQITQRSPDGSMVRATDRAEYFPILYSDPGELNRPVFGYDLASETTRLQVIQRAQAGNRPAATPPVKLANMQRPNGGMLSFIPVSTNPVTAGPVTAGPVTAGPVTADPVTAATASPPIAGIILAAFETDRMIENILATRLHLADLDMYVFNPDKLAANRLIYAHVAHGKPAPDEASLLAKQQWRGALDLVDQHWSVIFVPSDTYQLDIGRWTGFMALSGGLAMTLSIVLYLWISLRRTLQLEALTVSLHETTRALVVKGDTLDHMARHDALTGLANRVIFREQVANGLRHSGVAEGMAVLYLDLDRFKAVNDTLGHPIGDRLLCEVASRMRAAVRQTDTIARLGGDEFALVQFDTEQPDAAETLADRLIDMVGRPYDIEGNRVVIGVSVGIAVADRTDGNVDQVLRRADMALYVAKREGGGMWRSFEPTMEDDAQAHRRLENDLRDALENDRFELYYQPQVTTNSGQVCGFEALLRWRRQDGSLAMPGEFIQCAEATGLIVPIGSWALRTALRDAANWPAGIRVALNVSPVQMARNDLVDTVTTALLAAGQSGDRLELEITEHALLHHYAKSHAALQRLQALGVRIAMDDFGSGSASLSHLRGFPFDRLKIDQSFVAGMTGTVQGTALVRGILQLAASLNIPCIAEGVETQAQLDQLARDGCLLAQGFLFSPAQPPGAVAELITRRFAVPGQIAVPAQAALPRQINDKRQQPAMGPV